MKQLLLISVFLPFITFAQDIYYSQFYAAPLALNPALTGFYNGDMRGSLNYRNSSNGYIPYNTYSGSFDMKFLRESIKPDNLAIGIIVTNDNMGNGALTNLSSTASAAYHKAVDRSNKHFVSGGLQLGFFQRQANLTAFKFNSQWDNTIGLVEGLPSGELNNTTATSWVFDMNMGFMWYSRFNEKTALYAGTAVYHLTQPTETFYGKEQKFARRFVEHLGVRFAVSEQISIIPNVIFMFQNASRQLAAGSSYEFFIGETGNTFRLGTWYRHSDQSFIFSAGLQIREIIFGVSSDFLSPVQRYTRSQGAFEMSLSYAPNFSKTAKLRADPTKRF